MVGEGFAQNAAADFVGLLIGENALNSLQENGADTTECRTSGAGQPSR
jgi:hypothetical protein